MSGRRRRTTGYSGHEVLVDVNIAPAVAREEWMDDAACAQVGSEMFFPEKGGSTREAKRICGGCDVRAECLEYALKNDERYGIWGGVSDRDRRKLKRGDS